jgi:hypothetical protein
MNWKTKAIAAMFLVATACVQSFAWERDRYQPPDRPGRGPAVEVWYEYNDGSRLPTYDEDRRRSDAGRFYLEAVYGREYRIGVRNLTGERVGVVIAVDGRNIVSGERSNLLPGERMYVLDPWQTVRLDGWRTSRTEINRFYFTAPKRSYSVRAFGDRSAMGVIGVAAFREHVPPPPPERIPWLDSFRGQPPAPSAAAPHRQESSRAAKDLGTGFGRPEYAPVRSVGFDPDPDPVYKALFRYETRQALCRKGVIPPEEPSNRLWGNDRGFAPYPAD